MTVYFTAIHTEPAGSSDHEKITSVRWLNSADHTSKTFSKDRAVSWLEKGNKAWVADADGAVEVGVVNANPKYLRTKADGRWTNNLLSLPRF